jgi:CTP synthase
VPYIGPSGELKTKPTQHSVAALRSIGITPDAIVLRSDREIPASVKKKISLMCDVDSEAVVAAVDAPSIYDIPKVLHDEGLDAYIVRRLNMNFRDVVWGEWDDLLARVHGPKRIVRVGLVGKYVDLPDAYLSVTEALRAGGFAHTVKVEIVWIASDDCETSEGAKSALSGLDALCVPGGFGVRGIEGKLGALKFARENRIPTLGLCLGLQCMVIEVARNLAGLEGANSAEFDEHSPYPVVATMTSQMEVVAGKADMGASMRLGAYEARLQAGSIVAECYESETVSERHRHRYEVNNAYRSQISATGLHFSGLSPDGELVEFVELDRTQHPFYVGTQAHPEFKSRPTRPHPLFAGLIGAAIEREGLV